MTPPPLYFISSSQSWGANLTSTFCVVNLGPIWVYICQYERKLATWLCKQNLGLGRLPFRSSNSFCWEFISLSKLKNLRIFLSENQSLFLCTLFPGCKYVWNFENQSAEKYNFEFMSLHQPSFDSLRWNGAQFGSLGKELNMNSLSTLPFPIQYYNAFPFYGRWISFLGARLH